jgi:exodeoxyribonuclease VII large subunit
VAQEKAVEALQFDLGAPDEEPDAPGSAPTPRPEQGEQAGTSWAEPRSVESTRERRMQGLQLARQALEQASAREEGLRDDAVDAPPAMRPVVLPGAASDTALGVGAFYEHVRQALRMQFPDEIWVTGEVRKVSVSKGHRFVELADHEAASSSTGAPRGAPGRAGRWGNPPSPYGSRQNTAVLEVVCWSREWPTIAAALDAVGIELTSGLVVRVRGRVSVWDGGSKIRLSMADLDVEALVGGIAAARRKLLATLEAEGVIGANRRLPVSPVPLRIGLVTSARSEAHRDFMSRLEGAGLAFSVKLEHSLVQGPDAPLQIAAALRRLQGRDLDLIALVRGGGAKGDLAAFDHEAVARAIVGSRHPVWTGVGHTGDESVADRVANRAFVTPTACGEAIVDTVAAYLEGISARSRRLAVQAERALHSATRDVAARRSDLARAARHELTLAEGSLGQARGRLERGAALVVERCRASLERRAGRVLVQSTGLLATADGRLAQQRALLAAFDPKRQLERGWSLTRRPDGSIVRSIDQVAPEDEIVTVVSDGSIVSEARAVRRGSVHGGTSR